MNRIDLRQVDLNLLKAFDALERHRSVTKGAEALGLGQPAMSHALARLRELTLDELFVRSPGGLTPTARAMELIGPIRLALSQIEQALYGPAEFDARKSEHNFRIGMSDLVAAAVSAPVARRLAETAPGVSITILNSDRINAPQLLDDKEIDLAIGLFPETSPWHVKEPLFEERHSCVYNPALVKAKAPITLAQYVAHPHVLVTLKGDRTGFIDEILEKHGRKRRVLVSSPFFLLAGYLLHQLPVIATLPHHYASLCCTTSRLTVSPLPFKTPTFTISMLWHKRDSELPALKYLIETVRTCLEARS